MPTLTTLTSFNYTDGASPDGSVLLDADGDLFGTTSNGGAGAHGTVYELVNTGSGYAGAPTTLANFNGQNGGNSITGLTADAAGDLLGTTFMGGANGLGTVFQIPVSARGNTASLPSTVINGVAGLGPFTSPLSTDAAGDLFGVTTDQSGLGVVYEIAKAGNGYANAAARLATFSMPPGYQLGNSILVDASGNLFGTANGGAYGNGTVFEIPDTAAGYAAPVVLGTLNAATGRLADSGLSQDSAGDLFGTAVSGGASNDGTVYELAKTAGGYAAPVALVSFNGGNGVNPFANITVDGAGNLFGTTINTAFEIAKTPGGYASTPTTLATFGGANGQYVYSTLAPDSQGDLFGTTSTGGPNGNGTVFELSGTGFVPTAPITPSTVGTPVYRFYDPSDQGHFFTSSPSEVAQIQASNSGLVLEGPAFSSVNPATDLSAIQVYRFYDTANNSHFYTDSTHEVQQILQSQTPLVLEGPAFYVDPTMQAGDVTVYRFYEAQSGTHLYTDSPSEVASILAHSTNLTLEGPAFYVKA